jgi:hypothetical protein
MRTYMWSYALALALAACGSSESERPLEDARTNAVDARPVSSDGGTSPAVDAGGSHAVDGSTGGASADAPIGAGGADAPGGGDEADAPAGGDGADGPGQSGGFDAPAAAAGFHEVMSSLKLGGDSNEARTFAFDLDGDGKVDDRLNDTVITVGGLIGLDFDASLASLLQSGSFVVLDSIHADSLSADATAAWQLYVGNPQPDPDLTSGHGQFSIAENSPRDAIVHGAIAGERFHGGPDTVTIEVAVVSGAPPLHLELVAAQVQADLTETGCTGGKLGGAIPVSRLEADVYPTLAAALTQILAGDPENFFLVMLDANGDGTITAAELAANPTVKAVISPDLDLFDENGDPGTDGKPESISLALGFTCTNAIFTEPLTR